MQQQQYQQAAGHGRKQQGQYQGRHGSQGGWGLGRGGSRGGCQHRPSFVAQICAQNGQSQMVPYQGYQGGMFAPPNPFGDMSPFVPMAQVPLETNVPSPIKRYANWNTCFSCGFEVKKCPHIGNLPFRVEQA